MFNDYLPSAPREARQETRLRILIFFHSLFLLKSKNQVFFL